MSRSPTSFLKWPVAQWPRGMNGRGLSSEAKGSHAPELCFWERPGTTYLVPMVNRLPVFHNAENMETSKVTNCRASDLIACDSGPWDGSPTQTTSLRNLSPLSVPTIRETLSVQDFSLSGIFSQNTEIPRKECLCFINTLSHFITLWNSKFHRQTLRSKWRGEKREKQHNIITSYRWG